jgi:hypothetical protein
MNAPERLREGMVAAMVAAGALVSEPWIAAFSEVPRHAFLRRFFRQSEDLSGWAAVAGDDPGAWSPPSGCRQSPPSGLFPRPAPSAGCWPRTVPGRAWTRTRAQ